VRLFRSSVLKCLPFALVAVVAGQLTSGYAEATGQPLRGFATRDPLWWLIYMAATILSLLMCSAVTLRQARILEGAPLRIFAELRRAAARLPALVGFALPLGAVSYLLVRVVGAIGTPTLGLPLLYFVPAIAMSWPRLLISAEGREAAGPVRAVRSSLRLVAGHWWRTATLLAASLVIVIVVYVLGGLIGAMVEIAMLRRLGLLLLPSLALPLLLALVLATYTDLERRAA